MKNTKEILENLHLHKTGRLFDVKFISGCPDYATYVIKINHRIEGLVGTNNAAVESYLRKSFRNFYNLDKKLKLNKRPGRLSINKR